MNEIAIINEEVKQQLANPEVLQTLIATTFKGVNQALVPQAIVEGRIRGFTFKDFLEKNIYAVPYGQQYSLVTSIDYARKVGMRSGVIGKSAPQYEERQTADNKTQLISCTITIKRRVKEDVGEYTAKVYFNEYSTGKNLWTTKPRTMIAKVAEMHALRMACPEELSQAYSEEEVEQEIKPAAAVPTLTEEQIVNYSVKLESAGGLPELMDTWATLPAEAKTNTTLVAKKEELKKKYEGTQV